MSDKKQKKVIIFISMFALWILLVLTIPAYAYLDLLFSSMMLQVILGGIAGLVVVIKVFWHRILALSGIKRGKREIDKKSGHP